LKQEFSSHAELAGSLNDLRAKPIEIKRAFAGQLASALESDDQRSFRKQ
jgi:hypothetical protein